MAKKKKAAVNPARGFATTSVPSKVKPEKADEVAPDQGVKDKKLEGPTAPASASSGAGAGIAENAKPEKELYELTPEELEEQLEKNELQMMAEKYGPKVRKDVQRQQSKTQIDRRILRNQSQLISVSQWLPDEMLSEIIKLAKTDAIEDSQIPKHDTRTWSLAEDEIVVRFWALMQTLSAMDFSPQKILQILKDLLHLKPTTDNADYIWGLQNALDMLALDTEEDDLPPYDKRSTNPENAADASSDTESKSATGGSSSPLKIALHSPAGSRPSTPDSNNIHDVLPTRGRREAADPTNSADEDFDVSDVDSDAEPDQLVSVYLSAKARLYGIRPELLEGHRQFKAVKLNVLAANSRGLSPSARKLLEKMKRIESDVLFDRESADLQWPAKRIEIAQQIALERRLTTLAISSTGQRSTGGGIGNTETDLQNRNQAAIDDSPLDSDQISENSDILGGMFAPTDEMVASPQIGVQGESALVKLRDFGKITGIHPRRILDDACRARDSGAKLTYRMVSPTTYSCRHSVTISWSKGRDKLQPDGPPSVSLGQQPSPKNPLLITTMIFTMMSASTPDVQQSEAYIATAALFWIFSTSTSENKAYLKLPARWRDLWSEFEEHQKEEAFASDRKDLKMLRDLVHDQTREEEDDGVVLSAAFRGRSRGNTPGGSREPRQRIALPANPEFLLSLWNSKQSSTAYQQILPHRMNLPMFAFKDAALSAIEQHQVLILCGETGCGKSTQLPAYVLERELSHGRDCKIYCTQPRRISAISLAQRVSEELGEYRNDLGTSRSLVGYAIRLETKVAAHTKLVYATVGIVLRMLESSNSLDDITHLIIDEVHERSIDTDFLLIILLSLMVQRPELKVVLMSATVDATRFSKYLNNAPILTVPGRTFPVRTMFLEDAIELTHPSNKSRQRQDAEFDAEEESQTGITSKELAELKSYSPATRGILADYDEFRVDYELIVMLIERVFTDPAYMPFGKAVLVFLPGIAEIRELNDILVGHPGFNHSTVVYPLHSSIASEEQQAAFLVPPPGMRKIVLATNIAETGITIPDVTCVIDTGKHKEMRYDERRHLSRLIQSFISRANAKQRRGRAGRVQEGLCFHLFTRNRHDRMMAEQQTPEMLRLSLQDLVMRVKICKLGDIEQTLMRAMDPPSSKNIRRAIDALTEVGALASTQELTQLGNQLAKIPLDANLGKLCLLSAIFSCTDVGLTIAAILSSKSPFVTPFGQRQASDNARLSFAKNDSDLLTAYNAYCSWRRVSQDPAQNVFPYCRKYFLSQQNLVAIEDLKGQLLSSMVDTGLVPAAAVDRSSQNRNRSGRTRFVQVPPELDKNSANDAITTSVISWSFYPKLLTRDGKGWRNVSNSQFVTLHPTSIARAPSASPSTKILSYYSLMQASSGARNYNALSTTPVHDFALVLGPAGDAEWKIHAGVCVVDGNRLRFKVADWKAAIALKLLRRRLEQVVEVRLKDAGRPFDKRLGRWMEVWEKICSGDSKEGR